MRRTLIALASTTLVLAACGSDYSTADTLDTVNDSADTDDTVAASDSEAAAPVTDGAIDETAGTETDDPPVETNPDGEEIPPPPTSPDKPEVDIPAAAPTELQVAVLQEGEGPEAESGDTVIVHYVGVRSSDGVEFDNSYDRFEPFPVVLGTSAVIKGWDDGLVGAQTGQRIQLDIPSDLAYGPEARGDVIGADEALTFVIDVQAVIQQPDIADQPSEAGVPESVGATEVTTVDLIEGEGAELEVGDTAVMHLVLFRGDNLVALDTTWEREPIQIPMNPQGVAGLVEGMPGMKVGGRRAIVIPPESGFGPEGSTEIGLPAETDIIIVVDLLGKY
ncbi:MAG: FKBP-type peptidyl-prolyl cis-trans isomerase [Acidimicrobiia bacterium]|nr:FKBP-type peptidyl-prolyl cis-trans isomerase [Acidimicrobiia bacterium]